MAAKAGATAEAPFSLSEAAEVVVGLALEVAEADPEVVAAVAVPVAVVVAAGADEAKT